MALSPALASDTLLPRSLGQAKQAAAEKAAAEKAAAEKAAAKKAAAEKAAAEKAAVAALGLLQPLEALTLHR